jgi:hypothetical protein
MVCYFVAYHAAYLGFDFAFRVADSLDGLLEDGYLVRQNEVIAIATLGLWYSFV